MSETTIPAPTANHPFERAGLGLAPFRVVGSHTSTFQAIPGDPNSPIQPGAACDYCATGISRVFVIRSRDGREFKVGSECALKCAKDFDDRRMVSAVRAAINAKATAARHSREADLGVAAATLLGREDVRAALAAEPSRHAWKADGSALADAEWLLKHAGASGRAKLGRALVARFGAP